MPSIFIPKGCKPSKVVSRDQTRPMLCRAQLVRRGPKTEPQLWLEATDSYSAVAIQVEGDAEPGPIPLAALQLLERGRPGEQTLDGAWVFNGGAERVTYEHVDTGKWPSLESVGLYTDPPSDRPVPAIGFDPGFMANIAAALGDRQLHAYFAGPLKPIHLRATKHSDRVALQMPVRIVGA